jgi:hypothetical protein
MMGGEFGSLGTRTVGVKCPITHSPNSWSTYFSGETALFERRNTWLWNATREFFQSLSDPWKKAEEIVERFSEIGAGDGI